MVIGHASHPLSCPVRIEGRPKADRAHPISRKRADSELGLGKGPRVCGSLSSINTLLRFKVCETHLSELDINGYFHLVHVVIRCGFRETERQTVMIDPCSSGLVGGFTPFP
ncbi:ORFV2 [Zebra finch circovirus]|uniref:ORFV2 n=1 Tax=Zebra finch circovirus TaxID=1642515 RepID=A0A142LXW6_9CIRC|nr:ORFV2 [Zebra finch circovirus]